jgi:thiamine biosynthesis lipoprotein
MRAALGLATTVVLLVGGAACADPGADPGRDAEPARVERSVPVMGTVLRVVAHATADSVAEAAAEAGRSAVFRVDSLMSHYRPGSDVGRLTSAAGSGAWVSLSGETLEVLQSSLAWAERSGGAFDPTVGPLMRAWGFFDHEPARPTPERLAAVRPLVDWTAVAVEPAEGAARLEREGMSIDFGAIAKGYALDRAMDSMRAAGALAGMVDLGGNVSVFGPPPGGDSVWTVGIRHPRSEAELMGRVAVSAGSVATSGDYQQMFEEDGVRYSHLMDPRTGEPARGVVAVTVAAPGGARADALSTILFVLGPVEGRAFLDEHEPDVAAVWLMDGGDGELGEVVVREGPAARVQMTLPRPPADTAR